MTWEIANGSFQTMGNVKAKVQILEFIESIMATQMFHGFHQNFSYDVILGRKALKQLEITLDFGNSIIRWPNASVEMKESTFLNEK